MSRSDLVLGVDGGGTKTVAWLARLRDDGSGDVLGRGQAGPGNPRSAGFDVAQENIVQAIEAAFAQARLPVSLVAGACLGLAGAGRAVEQQRIAAWAAGRIAAQVHVAGDAETILAAAARDNWGIALICGTGSLAFGRNRQGVVGRCGGWGYRMGDEGSAHAIARAALQAAAQSADGRRPPTALLALLQKELAADTPEDLVGRIYARTMTRARIAALAKVVFDAAANDQTARELLDSAAGDLAQMVATTVRRLSLLPGEYPLALAGSVLLRQPSYCASVMAHLKRESVAPGIVVPVADPVRGAVALARQLVAPS